MNERFFVLTANRPFALRNAPGKGTRVWASAKVDTNDAWKLEVQQKMGTRGLEEDESPVSIRCFRFSKKVVNCNPVLGFL